MADQHELRVRDLGRGALQQVEVDDVVVEAAEEADARVRDGAQLGRLLASGARREKRSRSTPWSRKRARAPASALSSAISARLT